MYGLWKIHKETSVNNPVAPFQPILPVIGTCNYNLAKYFVPILKHFSINEYTFKDSFSFCKEIIDQDPNLFMASFDIQSLFTNIPSYMFERRDHVKKFLKYMNSRHLSIQFTGEEESNNKLTTSLYRKKTFTGVYLNSFLSMHYKKGLIHTLLFRAYNICVDYITLHTEIEFLKSIWQWNSFPLIFIDKCTKRFLDKLFIKRNVSGTVSKKKRPFHLLRILG